MELFYKVLNYDRMPFHGGAGQWPEPGQWHRVEGEIIPCERGLHYCRNVAQLLDWLGPEIWEIEVRGEQIHLGDKSVTAEARLVRQLPWNETAARLFAADCAEHVLHYFEDVHPGDIRPRQAIETARRYARGEIGGDELAAAGGAAMDAAGDAAWAAAMDAERDWQGARLRHYLHGTGEVD